MILGNFTGMRAEDIHTMTDGEGSYTKFEPADKESVRRFVTVLPKQKNHRGTYVLPCISAVELDP